MEYKTITINFDWFPFGVQPLKSPPKSEAIRYKIKRRFRTVFFLSFWTYRIHNRFHLAFRVPTPVGDRHGVKLTGEREVLVLIWERVRMARDG